MPGEDIAEVQVRFGADKRELEKESASVQDLLQQIAGDTQAGEKESQRSIGKTVAAVQDLRKAWLGVTATAAAVGGFFLAGPSARAQLGVLGTQTQLLSDRLGRALGVPEFIGSAARGVDFLADQIPRRAPGQLTPLQRAGSLGHGALASSLLLPAALADIFRGDFGFGTTRRVAEFGGKGLDEAFTGVKQEGSLQGILREGGFRGTNLPSGATQPTTTAGPTVIQVQGVSDATMQNQLTAMFQAQTTQNVNGGGFG